MEVALEPRPGEGGAWENFLLGFRSEATRESYVKKLRLFLRDAGLTPEGLLSKAREDPRSLERLILRYAEARKGEVSGSTIHQLRDALKHFMVMNDLENAVNWGRLGKLMPRARKVGADRAPSVEEIRRILDGCGIRMRAVVLLLCSSGIRVGALDGLRWGGMVPVDAPEGKLGRLTVYRGEDEQYTTFTTPECYAALKEYVRRRELEGERVTPNSPLLRVEKWSRAPEKGAPLPVSSKALRNEIGRLLERAGLREDGKAKGRHEFKQVHGFRKFFRTRCENAGVPTMIVEMLMGHRVGLGSNYYKPTSQELLAHYRKAIPHLTISEAEEVKSSVERRVADSDRKVGELERENLALQGRLDKMERELQELRGLIKQLIEGGG